MNLTEVEQSQKSFYNNFVASQISGSFLQSWEWGEWQVRLGRTVYRYFITDNDNIIGSMQVVKTPLPFSKYYFYLPYGPVILNDLEAKDILSVPSRPSLSASEGEWRDPSTRMHSLGMTQFFVNEITKKFPETVFVRMEPKFNSSFTNLNSSLIKSPNIQPAKTLIIDLTKTEEELLAQMHPKTRYNIKLAQKHNVEVQDEFVLTNGKGLYAKEAVELIAQTAGRQKYKTQGLDYFEKLVDFFAIHNPQADLKLHIYKALYNKELLTSAIILDFGNTRTYLFGGSSDLHREVMAPHLLHWTAMQDAKKLGLKYYDFWGIETASGNTPGFVRFKLGFAPQLRSGSSSETKQYPGAWDIVGRKIYYNLYSLLRFVNRMVR